MSCLCPNHFLMKTPSPKSVRCMRALTDLSRHTTVSDGKMVIQHGCRQMLVYLVMSRIGILSVLKRTFFAGST